MPLPGKKVAISEARRFMIECLKSVGANDKPAQEHADLLVTADSMGIYSHGLNRLTFYLNDIERKLCMPNNKPKLIKETASTAVVDARHCLGSTSSNYAMDLAMKKAKETGAGWITVRNANHFGIAGYWALKAAKANMIGIALTNASPLLTPTRSKKAALGTNSLAVAAPGHGDEMYYFDMSTTATSMGMIEMRRRRKQPLEIDIALGPDGKVTLDPDVAFKTKLLMPLGGGEKNSGYKGYGLSAAVEVLCGISAGANYSYKIRQWGDQTSEVKANLGQTFGVLDYNTFAPGFQDRLTDCLQYWRNLEPSDPTKPVLSPGDKERQYAKHAKETGNVKYIPELLKNCDDLAKRLQVKSLQHG